jgi:hypothetical protein
LRKILLAPEAAEAFAKLDRLHQANLYRRLHALADGALGSLGDVDHPTTRWTRVAGCLVRYASVDDGLLVLMLTMPPDEPHFGQRD